MIEASSADLLARIASADTALALGGVAVVGAGLSISSRFPVTRGLTSLLWDALDSDLPARLALAKVLGRDDKGAKVLVSDFWPDVEKAWAAVANSEAARARFQLQFSELDKERSAQPSPAHEGLARLIHAGVVECVISLNWDTALERAYQRLYGTSLPSGILFKPHGDANFPTESWTLPHEPGVVTPEILSSVNRLKGAHAHTLLVVGYSESDQVIVDELVRPLDQSWRTIRIGPNVSGVEDLNETAEVVLSLLAEKYVLREDSSAWHTVTFAGSRGVESWLAGERLGPQDVDACPELDEVETLRKSLQRDRAVVLNGATGSGKSICAYQALRRLMNDGYEVLRLRDNARQKVVRSWLTDLSAFPHRKVLFIDDAQDLSSDVVRELAETATPDGLVLIVGIDHVAGGVRTVNLSSRSAVARLTRFVREKRATLFPFVRALDDHVGSHPLDFHFEQRIDIAEQEATTWQFTYTLTGGWRRARRQMLELRERNRADLALAAIAVAQVAGVDSGVDQSELETLRSVLGRDQRWLDGAIDELLERRLIFESDGRLRCAHLRAAFNVITWSLHPPRHVLTPTFRPEIPPIASALLVPPPTEQQEESNLNAGASPPSDLPRADIEADRTAVSALITSALASPSAPLRGCTWLVGRNMDSDVRWILGHKGVLSDLLYNDLARRALRVPPTGDIAEAAQLLSEVITYSDGAVMSTVRAHTAELEQWYAAIAPENGWALGDLANSLYRPDAEFAARIAGSADARRLARLILDGGWPHIYSSSRAVDRLCNVGGQPLRDSIRPHLDEAAFKQMLDTNSPELAHISILIENISAADHDLSLRLLEHSAKRIAFLLSRDPVRRWNDMFGLLFHVLGYAAISFGDKDNLPLKCRRAAQTLVRELDLEKIALTLAGPQDQWGQMNFDSFIGLIERSDPPTFSAIAELLDFAKLEESLAVPIGQPTRTGLFLCLQLSELKPDNVRGILDRLEPSFTVLDPFIAYIAPDVAARALRRGLPLNLELDHHHWGWAAALIGRLAEFDADLAREVVESNCAGMIEGLTNNMTTPFSNLGMWIATCDKLAPELIDTLIAELPEGAITKWDRAIRRPQGYGRWHRDQIAPLVVRATKMTGYVQSEAMALIRRFPALKAYEV
ncbi:P-loop NTPase [Glutamicibacter arilaitensis]|uniref:P-loop NTPase n=1 Tax=Glutamicibacter arilaitensis TaxID=256701 RepID=UPI003F92E8AB